MLATICWSFQRSPPLCTIFINFFYIFIFSKSHDIPRGYHWKTFHFGHFLLQSFPLFLRFQDLRRFALHWRCHAAAEGERASPEVPWDKRLYLVSCLPQKVIKIRYLEIWAKNHFFFFNHELYLLNFGNLIHQEASLSLEIGIFGMEAVQTRNTRISLTSPFNFRKSNITAYDVRRDTTHLYQVQLRQRDHPQCESEETQIVWCCGAQTKNARIEHQQL